MPSTARQVRQVVPLRNARKDFTRTSICAAARDVFFAQGYAAATIEQIALAAGTGRSTLYTHFRDKEEILGAIMEDYLPQVRAHIARLPGPVPSREEIRTWVNEFAELATNERAPTILLIQTGYAADVPKPTLRFGEEFLLALAERIPAFRKALDPSPEGRLDRARANTALRELGWALYHHIGQTDDSARDQLTVAGELLDRFVREDH